jgi:hypothetical protein
VMIITPIIKMIMINVVFMSVIQIRRHKCLEKSLNINHIYFREIT